jgi:hypothetical protein
LHVGISGTADNADTFVQWTGLHASVVMRAAMERAMNAGIEIVRLAFGLWCAAHGCDARATGDGVVAFVGGVLLIVGFSNPFAAAAVVSGGRAVPPGNAPPRWRRR